jgi:GxxExxY protein
MINLDKNGHEPHIIEDLLFKDEVYAIIGAAFETHKILGPGFLEPVYQEAFEMELASRQIPFTAQPEIKVYYKGQALEKIYRADLIAYDKIIIELKALDNLTNVEEAQILNYLKATHFQLGLLINFGALKLEWKRRIFQTKNF